MTRSTPFKLKLVLGAVFLSSVSESMISIAFGLKAAAEGQASLLSAVLLASLLPQVLLGLRGGRRVSFGITAQTLLTLLTTRARWPQNRFVKFMLKMGLYELCGQEGEVTEPLGSYILGNLNKVYN